MGSSGREMYPHDIGPNPLQRVRSFFDLVIVLLSRIPQKEQTVNLLKFKKAAPKCGLKILLKSRTPPIVRH